LNTLDGCDEIIGSFEYERKLGICGRMGTQTAQNYKAIAYSIYQRDAANLLAWKCEHFFH